jgi:hypothetical protein
MPETHKNPEVDSAAGLHAEFEGVSPRSSDQTHGRVGRIHHDGPKHERPFKIPADVFLSSVLENREKEISPYHHPNQFFGEFTLAWMKDKYGDDFNDNTVLEVVKDQLLETIQDANGQEESYQHFIASKIVNELLSMGYAVDSDAPIIQQAIEAIRTMEPSEFKKYLKFHKAVEKRKLEQIAGGFERHKEEFVNRLVKAYSGGKFSANFDIEKAQKRILQTEVIGQDALYFLGFTLKSSGSYGIRDHTIIMLNISESEVLMALDFYSADKKEGVYSHEGVHAIAGKTIIQEAYKENYDFFDPLVNEPRVVKNGLSFSFSRRQQNEHIGWRGRRFEWLDEALTEIENIKILDYDPHNKKEREFRIYELLRQKGKVELPEELFEDAYFEDFGPSAPAGQRLPMWKKLRHALNAAYDRRFLVEFDDFILAYEYDGLDKAIAFLDNLDKGEYGQSAKTLQDIRKEKAAILGLKHNASWYEVAEAERKNNTN